MFWVLLIMGLAGLGLGVGMLTVPSLLGGISLIVLGLACIIVAVKDKSQGRL